MDRTGVRSIGEIAVVSAAGAIIGGLAAIRFGITAPIGVIIAIVVGGLAGYFLYQPKQAIISLREAYRTASESVQDFTWERAKPFVTWGFLFLAVCLALTSWVLPTLILWPTNRLADHFIFGYPFAMLALIVSISATNARVQTPCQWFSTAWWRYLNVIAVVTWILVGGFLAGRAIFRKAPRIWLALRIFTIVFFRRVHSHRRGICAFAAAIGAIDAFLSHHLLHGGVVAAGIATCILLASIAAMRIQIPQLTTENGS